MSKVRSAQSAGSIVRRVREDRGMSRAELSSKTGIGARTIYALEQGQSKNFGLENYLKILDALGLEMFVDIEEPHATPEPTTSPSSALIPEFKLADVWKLDECGER